MHKRQFAGTSKPRVFFERKLRVEGHGKSLSVGKVIPKNWTYVRMEVIDRNCDTVTIKVTKLLEDKLDAQVTTTDSGSGKNP